MTISAVAVLVATLSFLVSALTLWLTVLRRGALKMTLPTLIYVGPDGRGGPTKIYIRTLLYTTGYRGRVLDNMYLRVSRGETVQNFNIWVCGEQKISRGSGLFVGAQGVALNHHFLHPKDGNEFTILPGDYRLQIFATTVGRTEAQLLYTVDLPITSEQSRAVHEDGAGVFFDWGPDSRRYHAHIDTKPDDAPTPDFITALMNNQKS